MMTYSHDGVGLGHLRRNVRLVKAALEGVAGGVALMVTGSSAPAFELPPSVDYLKLPALTKVANDHYVSRQLGLDRDDVTALRSAIILAALEQFQPDLFLVDFYPLGVHRELETALRRLRATQPSARVVLGWRDILDDPQQVRKEWWDTGQIDAIGELFDAVLVYGSPLICDPVDEYELPPAIADRVTFTGYLVADAPLAWNSYADGHPVVVCALGGGEDGITVGRRFLEAMAEPGLRGWRGVLVTGPLMPLFDRMELAAIADSTNVSCATFVEDMPGLLAAADVVVSMGGYNTVCEVLAGDVPAVVIPRVAPRKEQLLRATRLSERGLIAMLAHDDASPERLAAEIGRQSAARGQAEARRAGSVDLGGLGTAGALLADALQLVRVPA